MSQDAVKKESRNTSGAGSDKESNRMRQSVAESHKESLFKHKSKKNLEDTMNLQDNISSTSSQQTSVICSKEPPTGKILPNTTKNGKSSVKEFQSNAGSRPSERRVPYTSKGKKKTDLSVGSNGSGSSTGSQSGDQKAGGKRVKGKLMPLSSCTKGGISLKKE